MSEPARLSIAQVSTETATSSCLAARLERRFGLGAMPEKRKALYMRIQLLVEARPEVETLVREAASQATSARFPDRYFCSAIVKKLRETNSYEPL